MWGPPGPWLQVTADEGGMDNAGDAQGHVQGRVAGDAQGCVAGVAGDAHVQGCVAGDDQGRVAGGVLAESLFPILPQGPGGGRAGGRAGRCCEAFGC